MRLLASYQSHLRRTVAAAGPFGNFGWMKIELAKVFVPTGLLALLAAMIGWQSFVGLALLAVAAVLAVSGMALILYVGTRYNVRVQDKRYEMFTRKKLGAEYRKDR